MNALILTEQRFEEIALLSGLEPIEVRITFFEDSRKTKIKTAKATILVTDHDINEFHLKFLILKQQLSTAEWKIHELEQQLIMFDSESSTQIKKDVEVVESASPIERLLTLKAK